MTTRILLVNDNQEMRAELCALLGKESDLNVISAADSGRKAIQVALAMSPDLVLMDISMKDMSGIEAVKQILAESPDQKIIILSLFTDKRLVKSALHAGAKGYLLKNRAFHELSRAIRVVVSGEIYLSSDIQINKDEIES